jgi:hypothetical protein
VSNVALAENAPRKNKEHTIINILNGLHHFFIMNLHLSFEIVVTAPLQMKSKRRAHFTLPSSIPD